MDEQQLRLIAGIIEQEIDQTRKANANSGSLAQVVAELRDEVDALQYEFEKRIETEMLAKDLSGYLKDRREEIGVLRIFRILITGFGLMAATAVASILYVELARGLPHLKAAGDHAVVAFIAGSFIFCLGIILVVMRGVFGGLHEAETEAPYPEHIKEALSLVKEFKSSA